MYSFIVVFSAVITSPWIVTLSRAIIAQPFYPNNLPFGSESQSGPLLWPQPSHWSSSLLRYRLPTNRLFQIHTSRRLRHCDIVQHNLHKYNAIIQSLIDSVSYDCDIRTLESTTATDQNNNNPTPLEPILKEVYLLINNLNCSNDVYPEFIPNNNNHYDDDNGNKPITSFGAQNINGKFNDENYSIEIQPESGTAILYGSSVWGAVRALETFSQLLYIDTIQMPNGDSGDSEDSGDGLNNNINNNNCQLQSAVFVNVSRVLDKPRFVYRSVLIDTARHFVPISIILNNLNAMAYNKFNILHWHLSDDQSFPFESKIFANFSRFAPFSKCHIYGQNEIRMVVEEARLRAIQVIVEIDTPAHSHALGRVFPNLLTKCHKSEKVQTATSKTINKNSNIIDPSQKESFQIVKQLLAEIRQLFPSKWIHLGMDDVNYDCWNSSLEVQQFMKQNQLETLEQLEQFYLNQIVSDQVDLKGQIVWQDPFDKAIELPVNTIVEVWKDERNSPDSHPWQYYMEQIVKQNRTAVLASCWFLNIIRYGQDWKEFYNCDPHDFEGSDEKEKRRLVIGGEACLWGEYVDETNLLARLWPRASAVAERLWSEHIEDQTMEDVQLRLDEQRCRMLKRGIPAQPIHSGYCSRFGNQHDNNREYLGEDSIRTTSMMEQPNEVVVDTQPMDEVEFNVNQSDDNYQSSKKRNIQLSDDYTKDKSRCRSLHLKNLIDQTELSHNSPKLSQNQIINYEDINSKWNFSSWSQNSHHILAIEIGFSLNWICLSLLVVHFLLKF